MTLLDDEHANLDKKRAPSARITHAPATAPEEQSSGAAARSFGLAPPVAARLAALLLLSLRDDASDGAAIAGTEVEQAADAV